MFLQETHFSHDSNFKILSKNYPLWFYGDSPTKQAKGVAIGFARAVRFTLEDRKTDPEGRYLFLRGRIIGVEYSLANIYCPNTNPIKYLIDIIKTS